MNVILMGSNRAAINCYEVLRQSAIDKVLVFCPRGGTTHAWHESLGDHVRRIGEHEWLDPHDVNDPEMITRIEAFRPDVIFSVFYDQVLCPEILSIPSLGCINFHPSILPKYRGVAPLIWAIMNGESETGITAHFMEARVDVGDIIHQLRVSIGPNETGYTLHCKVAEMMPRLFAQVLGHVASGTIPRRPQSGVGSFYRRSDCSRNRIDWTRPREEIRNLIRALAPPLPGAYFDLRHEHVVVCSARVPTRLYTRSDSSRPGDLRIGPSRELHVQCGDGVLELLEVACPGDSSLPSNLVRILSDAK